MAGGEHQEKPISLFYSYSHKDEDLRRKLEDHLAFLRWSGMVAEWNDRNIDVGQEWEKEIDRNLSSADIILLLVSASFIASKYCWSVEVRKALERHDRGEAKVIPVILRPCRWTAAPFAKLQAAPKDAKPVSLWADQDEAFDDVVSRIERVVTDLHRKRAAAPSSPHPDPLPPGEGDLADAAGIPHPPADAGPSLSRRERGGVRADPRDLPDFAVFREVDAPWCPEMVARAVGEFLMGSPESDEESYSDERPQHRVIIGLGGLQRGLAPFARRRRPVGARPILGREGRIAGWHE